LDFFIFVVLIVIRVGRAGCGRPKSHRRTHQRTIKITTKVSLPVKTEDALTGAELDTGSLILVGRPGENQLLAKLCAQRKLDLSADTPGAQGYWIRFVSDGKRRLALLAGRDPVGMLYACVTFRRLVRRQDENVCAVEANIQDWPDVRWRFTWTVIRQALRATFGYDDVYRPDRAAAGIELAKRQLDWFLRHKINVFNRSSRWRRIASLAPTRWARRWSTCTGTT